MSNIQNCEANIQDKIRQIIKKALCLPSSGISYYVSQELAKIYPQKALEKGSDYAFGDDKLPFNLPGLTERVAYIQRWNEGKLKPPIKKPTMRLSDTELPQIAELTDGFSFACLQELFFSSMDLWMETQKPGEMDRIMISQVSELKEQISLSEEGETNKKEKVNQFLSLFKMLSQEE